MSPSPSPGAMTCSTVQWSTDAIPTDNRVVSQIDKSVKLYNHGEGPYKGLLLVESAGLVSIHSAACPLLRTFALHWYPKFTSTHHRLMFVYQCLKCESASRRFQPGEGLCRGLLRDCTTSLIYRLQH